MRLEEKLETQFNTRNKNIIDYCIACKDIIKETTGQVIGKKHCQQNIRMV